MKSKYRKMTNMIVTLTLCIGTGMLSLAVPGSKYGSEKADPSDTMKRISEIKETEEDGENIASADTRVSPTPSPAPSPTPTPAPVYPLEEKDYPEAINTLIDTYYKAKISLDMDTLKSISTDPKAVPDKESLKKIVEGIEDCLNMKCYVKRTYEEDFYIVWVYYDIKFISLDTYAPSLSKFYIKKDASGEFKVYDGELDAIMKAYVKARNSDQDVIELKKNTEKLEEEAKEKDEKLRNYWEVFERN